MHKQKKYPWTIEQQNWTETDLEWIDALENIDYRQDKKPICQLLRSEMELLPLVRSYLADLIERRASVRAVSAKRLPAYHHGISPLNWHYLMTHQKVDAMMEADPTLSLDNAIAKAATEEGFDTEVLHDSYSGKNHSFELARKKLVDQP
jgi:hypothetical protein